MDILFLLVVSLSVCLSIKICVILVFHLFPYDFNYMYELFLLPGVLSRRRESRMAEQGMCLYLFESISFSNYVEQRK